MDIVRRDGSAGRGSTGCGRIGVGGVGVEVNRVHGGEGEGERKEFIRIRDCRSRGTRKSEKRMLQRLILKPASSVRVYFLIGNWICSDIRKIFGYLKISNKGLAGLFPVPGHRDSGHRRCNHMHVLGLPVPWFSIPLAHRT
jgi:hypothetical protein